VNTMKYSIGIDYGTDSVRALIVNVNTGEELASAVYHYPQWKAGKHCDPPGNLFRQHPSDYLEGLEYTIGTSLDSLTAEVRQNIVAISVDTTGSTPVAVNREGVPLSLTPGFENNPNAMFVLWKDHTAVREADEINELARSWRGIDYTKYEGGIYSSEWFWAKVLHIMRVDKEVRETAFSWVEHCDWIPAVLTGNTDPLAIKRSRCAAGHKAMWHEDFNGLPSENFLQKLDPLLSGLREKLYRETYTSDVKAGVLCQEWASRLGLSTEVVVGVGSFDAHMGAVGGQIEPYYLSKVMGTSTCDMLVAPNDEFSDKLVAGISGQVDGSIIPGMTGLEAGQSAFGDIYAWYAGLLMWPVEKLIGTMEWLGEETRGRVMKEAAEKMIAELSAAASKTPPTESAIVALDWMNGRRTPDANQELKGAITGLTLGSDAPRIFRALVEATAFGSKMITERFVSEGVRIDGIIAMGGVAKKSPFVMQIVTDVLDMPIKVAKTEQASALGSAMAAAVVAGIHPDFATAQKTMGGGFEKEYYPDPERATVYRTLFEKYRRIGNFTEQEQSLRAK
jgi:L-ribulokinase